MLSALFGCIFCLIYPVISAPVPMTTTYAEPHQFSPAGAVAGASSSGGSISSGTAAAAAAFRSPDDGLAAANAAAPREPLQTHGYFCKQNSCNTCHFRPSEIRPASPDPAPNGDSKQGRVEGTNVTRAELAEKGIRFLQVGGDWWNKCGDGWLNSDFIFTRLPVGFVCEDWRTGRYILRQDAGHRWPFEDNSFEAVYSEHMFEHILPMDGSTFLKEMYRVLKPGGGVPPLPFQIARPQRRRSGYNARRGPRPRLSVLAPVVELSSPFQSRISILNAPWRSASCDHARPRKVLDGIRQSQDRPLPAAACRALSTHGKAGPAIHGGHRRQQYLPEL